MPICPKHPDKQMMRVYQGVETIGKGWDSHMAYFEDYLCPDCQFRLRLHYTIIQLGGVKKDEVPSRTE